MQHVSNCCIAGEDSVLQGMLLTVLEVVTSVTTAANDLQHLRNRRLTAAATGRQYRIHPQTVRN